MWEVLEAIKIYNVGAERQSWMQSVFLNHCVISEGCMGLFIMCVAPQRGPQGGTIFLNFSIHFKEKSFIILYKFFFSHILQWYCLIVFFSFAAFIQVKIL